MGLPVSNDFIADQHSARLSIRRAELVETKDEGELQEITAHGYADETFSGAHRVQPFGFSSHVPKGAHGLALVVNGRTDQTAFIGMEHPEYRPKNQPEGSSRQYDKDGSYCDMDGDGNFATKCRKESKHEGDTIVLKSETMVYINC